MYKLSKASLDKLSTCHPNLQAIVHDLIKIMDVTVLEGVRTLERQKELFNQGMTKTMNSKHLAHPPNGYSHAVDLAPFPVDWKDRDRFVFMQGMVQGIALKHGIKVRSGIDWDSDGETKDTKFWDSPHMELV